MKASDTRRCPRKSIGTLQIWLLCIPAAMLLSYGCGAQGGQRKATILPESKAIVGCGCDGCELMYVSMPQHISATSTSPGWRNDVHRITITGTVYRLNGKTPAPNVVLYYWHTDEQGRYTADSGTPKEAAPHGRMRGWVKSDSNGKYAIRTMRPGPYPRSDNPAHIHFSIREPNLSNEYYADRYFAGDPLYAAHAQKHGIENRCGSELLQSPTVGSPQVIVHNFVLGKNIPDYPVPSMTGE